MNRVGEKIGDTYLLTEMLGEGGMGEVYLAEKFSIVKLSERERGKGKQKVAVKLAKTGLVDEMGFEAEVDIWLAASDEGHPHILPIHHAAKYGEDFLIETKYVAKGSLNSLLKRVGLLSVVEAAGIMDGILSGLNFLHSRPDRIIHRDLKPDNVLMDGNCPLIADFGISRVLKSDDSSISLRFSGTPEYSAPEVFRFGRRSEHGDIWAAGVILYEMLAGTKPFTSDGGGERVEQVAQKVLNNMPPPLPNRVSDRLSAVIAKAMATDTAARYASAEEMRLALAESFVVTADEKKTIRDESFTPAPSPEFKPPKQDPVPVPSKPPISTGPHYLRWAMATLLVSISAFAGIKLYERSTSASPPVGLVETAVSKESLANNVPSNRAEVQQQPTATTSKPLSNEQSPIEPPNRAENRIANQNKQQTNIAPTLNNSGTKDTAGSRKETDIRKVPLASPKPADGACPENDLGCLIRKARKH